MRGREVVFMLLMSVALGCTSMSTVSSAPPTPVYHPSPHVDVQVFYDELAPYGTWLWLEGHGQVWAPHGVPAGWRPYTVGRWVYTDVGWTWVSDWEWGWAPFHYGRWTYTPAYGWVWVPDTVWGPAWVVWKHGPGWVGWAPLPPAAVWEPHGQLNLTYIERHVHPSSYCFVREHHLLAPRVHHYIVSPAENVRLVHVTKNVTHYTIINKQVVNQSVHVESVERATKRPVPRLRLVDADSSQRRYHGRVKEQEGQVTVFRPRVARSTPDTGRPGSHTPAPPSVVPGKKPQTPVPTPTPGIQAAPAPPPVSEPPRLSPPPQEDQRRRQGRDAAIHRRPSPQAPPSVPVPHVRTPQEESQEERPNGRSPRQRFRTPPENGPAAIPQPRPRSALPPPVRQGSVVTPSPSPQSPAGALRPSPAVRQERRGPKPPQGQQHQDKEPASQGSSMVPPAGAVPPTMGSEVNPSPRQGSGPRSR